jgi:hypothetical protein
MKSFLLSSVLLAALCSPALCQERGHSNVPGPILGAGLPVIAVAYGAYWLIRRRRNPQ